MRFFMEYPLSGKDDGAWVDPANMAEFARVAEECGIEGLALTDHPAPSRKWLDAGGHDTLEPFAGLCFFAAHTTTLRLMTYLTVVPYRNPFLLAKSMTTVDILSGGRATFVLGTGYLRSEFAALGIDFEQRNTLFDEGMEVVRGQLASPHEYRHEGEHFTGMGVTMSPAPIQHPHPPLWIGGNAAIVRRRVAAWAQGWAPLTLGGEMMGKVSRTAPILSMEQFAEQVQEIKESMAAQGRDPELLDVAAPGTEHVTSDASAEKKIDHIASLAEHGVTWTTVPIDKTTFKKALDDLRDFAAHVIPHTR